MLSLASRDERLHSSVASQDVRAPGQRDRDRILYSEALRRLAGVTQVVSASEGQVFHNRLTHTLEVAQIGRRLAEKLLREQGEDLANAVGGVDPEVVEAAALAHDLGHPPFGHIAEAKLDELSRKDDPDFEGFEGNAQSFRIVTRLAIRRETPGLDLTRATLNAILKYPWLRNSDPSHKAHRKWGAYVSEAEEFNWARREVASDDTRKTAEAELMDWADDIAYSVHDVEDFYRAGLIPLDHLITRENELNRFVSSTVQRWQRLGITKPYSTDDLWAMFASLIRGFPLSLREPYRGTREQRADLRTVTSSLIGRYIGAIRLKEPQSPVDRVVEITHRHEMEITMLKELVWEYIIDNAALSTQQYGQRKVIEGLYDIFCTEAFDKRGHSIFPLVWREMLEVAESEDQSPDRARKHIVVDFISSMTEQEALKLYQRLTGVSLGSVVEVLAQ